MKVATLLALLGLLATAASCAPAIKPPRPTVPPKPAAVQPEPETPKLTGPPGLPSQLIATLESADIQFLYARNGQQDGLLLSRSNNRWWSAAVSDDPPPHLGEQPSKMTPIAPAPDASHPAALHAVGENYLAVWSQPTKSGSTYIWALSLDAKGASRGKPQPLAHTSRSIHWLQILPTLNGALVLWEARHDERRQLYVTNWQAGKPPSTVSKVADHVLGWHAVHTATGAAIAWVHAHDDKRGTVHLIEVDTSGQIGTKVDLLKQPTALFDIQLAALRKAYLVGWTDVRDDDAHVYLTAVAHGGAVTKPPRPAIPPVGSQALVALVSAPTQDQALLAWESPISTASHRTIAMVMLNADGKTSSNKTTSALYAPNSVPQIVADGTGFAALTLAPLRLRDSKTVRDEPFIAPIFIRFDSKLNARTAEPIRLAEFANHNREGLPSLVESLHCAAKQCSVIGRSGQSPSQLRRVSLPVRPNQWESPISPRTSQAVPQAEYLHTVSELQEPIADIDAVRLADGRTLVAWVTHANANDSGQPQPAPPNATLAFRFIDADGRAGKAHILSRRAISIGGVSLRALPKARSASRRKGVAVLAWAGPHNKSSQVYLTKIGHNGRKLRQKTLTKLKRRHKRGLPNEVSSVSLAHGTDNGFLCAWSDTRDGNAEIYAVRANAQLDKRGTEKRLTKSRSPSTEPRILVRGADTFLVWSESDEDASQADIWGRRLSTKTLKPAIEPKRLLRSSEHSRSPQLLAGPQGRLVAGWIEEASSDGGVRLAELDRNLKTVSTRLYPPGAELAATSFTLRCQGVTCRLALTSVPKEAIGAASHTQLSALTHRLDQPANSNLTPLATIDGGNQQDALLVANANDMASLFFVHARRNTLRLRQLGIAW